MANACDSFEMLLSAFADGELRGGERRTVEAHLAGCGRCQARLAEAQAASAALRSFLEVEAESADFSGFSKRVLARITPERPGLLERLSLSFREILAYHRAAVLSSMATAAVMLAVGVPLWLARGGDEPTIVRSLKVEDPRFMPVVMKGRNGRTIIWVMEHDPKHLENMDDGDGDLEEDPGVLPSGDPQDEDTVEIKAPNGGDL